MLMKYIFATNVLRIDRLKMSVPFERISVRAYIFFLKTLPLLSVFVLQYV